MERITRNAPLLETVRRLSVRSSVQLPHGGLMEPQGPNKGKHCNDFLCRNSVVRGTSQQFPDAEIVARALGGTRTGSQWLAKCPAHDDARPSLSIREGDTKPIFHCFGGCSFREVQDALTAMGLWPEFRGERREVKPRPPAPVGPSADELRKRSIARRLFDYAFPCLQSTPCEAYLRSRGIWEAANASNMRFGRFDHQQTHEAFTPCLVIPRHDPATDSLEGIQRIFLTEDGAKYPRKELAYPDGSVGLAEAKLSLGSHPNAWAMLYKATDQLVLAEGSENALTASILYERPGWARCGPFPSQIILPNHVRDVLIVADNDAPIKNGRPRVTSEAKAIKLAEFIRSTGRRSEVVVPSIVGMDINDVLLRGAA